MTLRTTRDEASRHFAFVGLPAAGHVNPTLALVEELVARGHRVSYVTGPEAVPAVRAAGAEPVPVSLRIPDPPPTDASTAPVAAVSRMERFLADVRQSFPEMLERFDGDVPDVVCSDAATSIGRMLAEKLRIVHTTLLPGFASNDRFSLRDLFTEQLPSAFDPNNPVLRDFGQRMRAFAERYGVSFDFHSMMSDAGDPLNLVFLPKEFQIEADGFDERFVFLGPMIGSRAAGERWRPTDPDKPLLFVSPGTLRHERVGFYRRCVEAFGDGAWQVAMAIGDRVDPAELGEVPDNFEVRPWFPQPAVLRAATAFLTHAGMNSTMEALYYGVPMVTVPRMLEQELNADRVTRLDAGRRLDPHASTGLLRETVDEVAGDESVLAGVRELRDLVRGYGGAAAGADALRDLLAERDSG
ncbi:macrolide family glycosyltransferase [Actinopolyspora sp. H202]|uniref:macrolide family glycosyltransferase n=1 Tax=Actinopolyspora sp. H202 TaxID=1500456 RepID=UPI003EE7B3BF